LAKDFSKFGNKLTSPRLAKHSKTPGKLPAVLSRTAVTAGREIASPFRDGRSAL